MVGRQWIRGSWRRGRRESTSPPGAAGMTGVNKHRWSSFIELRNVVGLLPSLSWTEEVELTVAEEILSEMSLGSDPPVFERFYQSFIEVIECFGGFRRKL